MIVLFDFNNNHYTFNYMITIHKDYEYVISNEFNYNLFNKAKVIIPMSIEAGIKLFELGYEYKFLRKKCLVIPENIYYTLDNKILFYEMIKENNLLKNTNIKLIPSYDNNYIRSNKKNFFGEFLLKHRLKAGTTGNINKSGYIYDIIEKYNSIYQIQDIIDVKYISGYNIVCNYGNIINTLNFITPHNIESTYYFNNNKQYLYPINEQQYKVVENIVKYTKYSGFAEIEFIIDNNDNYYLLECNPRISGNLMCMISESFTFNKNNICPYYKDLILAYINSLLNKKIEYKKYNKIVNLIYYGNI